MIEKIRNNYWLLNALEKLRKILDLSENIDMFVLISIAGVRIERLTEENQALRQTNKTLRERNDRLIRQQRKVDQEAMNHLDWDEDDRR